MSKKLCDMKKRVEKELETIASMVRPARYICTKCARAASRKEFLCKPVPLPEASGED